MGVVFSLYYGWDASLVDEKNITQSVVAVKGRGFNFPIDLSSRHHPRTSKAWFVHGMATPTHRVCFPTLGQTKAPTHDPKQL
jgi:hypothetical protein